MRELKTAMFKEIRRYNSKQQQCETVWVVRNYD